MMRWWRRQPHHSARLMAQRLTQSVLRSHRPTASARQGSIAFAGSCSLPRLGHGRAQTLSQTHTSPSVALLGAVERLPHLGPARFERLDAQTAQALVLDPRLGPGDEVGDALAARVVLATASR